MLVMFEKMKPTIPPSRCDPPPALQNSSDAVTWAHLSGFRPDGSYQISVFSYTGVGHGDQYSRPISFTTNESGIPLSHTHTHTHGDCRFSSNKWGPLLLVILKILKHNNFVII